MPWLTRFSRLAWFRPSPVGGFPTPARWPG